MLFHFIERICFQSRRVFSGLTLVAPIGWVALATMNVSLWPLPAGFRSNEELSSQAGVSGGPGNSLEMFSHHS